MDKRKIILIAGRVRRWMEQKAGEYEICPVDLGCGCAIACARLLGELLKNGINDAGIILGEGHTYIMIDDHILDVTATQFNGFEKRKVLFMPWSEFLALPQKKTWWTYDPNPPVKCPKEFRNSQISYGWPDEQIIREEHLVDYSRRTNA